MTSSAASETIPNADKSDTVAKWRLLERFGKLITGCYKPPEVDCAKTTE